MRGAAVAVVVAGCLTDPAEYAPLETGGSGGVGAADTSSQGGESGALPGGGGAGVGGEGLTGGDAQWLITHAVQGDQSFDALAVSVHDEIYAGGTWQGSFDIGVLGDGCQANNTSTAFVQALNPDGMERWARCFGSDARVQAIDVNVAGDIAVVGSFRGDIDVGNDFETARGGADVFVVVLEPDTGDIVWGMTFGSIAEDEGQGVAIGPAQELYVAGVYRAPMSIGNIDLPLSAPAGLFRARLVAGAETWAQGAPTGGPSPNIHLAIRKNGAGPVVAAGTFSVSIDPDGIGPMSTTTSADAADDMFVLRFDLNGVVDQFLPLRAPGAQQALAVHASSESLLVSGLLESSLDFDRDGGWPEAPVVGGPDAFLLSMDFSHALTGLALVSGAGTQRGFATALPRVGSSPLVLAGDFVGSTELAGASISTAAGASDGFVASYAGANAAPSFARRVGGSGPQSIRAVGLLDEDLIIAGTFAGAIELGETPVEAEGQDVFIARIRP